MHAVDCSNKILAKASDNNERVRESKAHLVAFVKAHIKKMLEILYGRISKEESDLFKEESTATFESVDTGSSIYIGFMRPGGNSSRRWRLRPETSGSMGTLSRWLDHSANGHCTCAHYPSTDSAVSILKHQAITSQKA